MCAYDFGALPKDMTTSSLLISGLIRASIMTLLWTVLLVTSVTFRL